MIHGIEAVVFDLDGTLIDSAPGLHRACCAMLEELDLSQPDLSTVIGFVGNGAPKLVERCLTWAEVKPEDYPTALDIFLEHYNRDPLWGTTVYDGAHDLLARLAAQDMALGLCTNKPEAPTRAILRAFGLGPFTSVIGGDSLAQRKPHPAPLLHVIAALGATPRTTLYVGDSITDWHTAKAAETRYAHVAGGYQSEAIPDFAPWLNAATLEEISKEIAGPK